MKRIGLAFAVIVMISGCAQNQMATAQGSRPTTKSFESCGVSVRFSGEPDVLQGVMADSIHKEFGAQPEGPPWVYLSNIQGVTKVEAAFCVCPPEPNLSLLKLQMIATDTIELPITEMDSGSKLLTKMTTGKASSSCLTVQYFAVRETNEAARKAAVPFFSSLTAVPNKPRATDPNRGSASERLKQLDQLLSEKLITSKEYETRRTAILESL